MGENLLKKINNNNYKIVNELIEIITEENISSIEDLYDYQNDYFKINGRNLSHNEQIEYCTKKINSNLLEDIRSYYK